MSKATIVKITRINERGTVVCTTDEKFFTITSFDKVGVLNIEADSKIDNVTINEFAEIVVGCFLKRSSFRGVGWINFTYDDIKVHVTRGEATNHPSEYLVSKWEKALHNKQRLKAKSKK